MSRIEIVVSRSRIEIEGLRRNIIVLSKGSPGPQGDPGPAGPTGPGVATGGTTGQFLAKASGTNFDTEWVDDPVTDDSITFARMQNIAGQSVIGKPDTGTGDPTVISTTTDNQILIRRSGILTWATLVSADMPAHAARHQHGGADEIAVASSTANGIPKANSSGQLAVQWLGSGTPTSAKYLRGDGAWTNFPTIPVAGDTIVDETTFDSPASGGSSDAYSREDHTHGTPPDPIPPHVADSDPHVQYQKESEKDANSGYAGLDANQRLTKPAKSLYDGVSTNLTISAIADGGLLARSGTGIISLPAIGTYLLDTPNVITDGYFRDSVGVSVIGRSANSTGDPADIVASADGQVLMRTGGSLGFIALPKQEPAIRVCPFFATANLTATKTITSTSSFAIYMGKAASALTSVAMRYRVTTAAGTITWAEVALAKGAPVLAGNPSLTVVGHTDVSGVINSLGQKSTTINVAGGQSIAAGDDLWLIIGNQANTAAVVRAASIADDLQVGFLAAATARPSLIVGTPTSFTLEGATTLGAWVGMSS